MSTKFGILEDITFITWFHNLWSLGGISSHFRGFGLNITNVKNATYVRGIMNPSSNKQGIRASRTINGDEDIVVTSSMQPSITAPCSAFPAYFTQRIQQKYFQQHLGPSL